MRSPRIIVTGASGFLGQALLNCLAKEDVDVFGISRGHHPGLIHVKTYEDTPPGDILIHLAETSDRNIANQEGQNYEKKAIHIIKNLQKKGFSRIIYASSAVLYGDDELTPRRVGDPVVCNDTYSRLKLNCEKRVLLEGGAVARFSNIYGPKMSKKNVVGDI